MKRLHTRTLVLNADYQSIGLVNWKRAVVLSIINQEKPTEGVEVIDFYKNDYIEGTNGRKFPIPAVVRLPRYIRQKKRKIPFSRKNVFVRDQMTCQYCGFHDGTTKFLTYDHVIPRAVWKRKAEKGEREYQGTPTNWTNIVTCCVSCNRKKADFSLKESGFKLKKQPTEPNAHHFILGLSPWSVMPVEWEPYLTPIYKAFIHKRPLQTDK